VALGMVVLVLSFEPKRECLAVNFLAHTSMAYILLPTWKIWHSMGETSTIVWVTVTSKKEQAAHRMSKILPMERQNFHL